MANDLDSAMNRSAWEGSAWSSGTATDAADKANLALLHPSLLGASSPFGSYGGGNPLAATSAPLPPSSSLDGVLQHVPPQSQLFHPLVDAVSPSAASSWATYSPYQSLAASASPAPPLPPHLQHHHPYHAISLGYPMGLSMLPMAAMPMPISMPMPYSPTLHYAPVYSAPPVHLSHHHHHHQQQQHAPQQLAQAQQRHQQQSQQAPLSLAVPSTVQSTVLSESAVFHSSSGSDDDLTPVELALGTSAMHGHHHQNQQSISYTGSCDPDPAGLRQDTSEIDDAAEQQSTCCSDSEGRCDDVSHHSGDSLRRRATLDATLQDKRVRLSPTSSSGDDSHFSGSTTGPLGEEEHYVCRHCARVFQKSDSLRKHVYREHSGLSRVQCTYDGCDMLFKSATEMRSHYLRKHSCDKPHRCTFCNRSYAISGALRAHLRRSHPKEMFPCQYCDRCFGYISDLRTHVQRKHKITMPSCKQLQLLPLAIAALPSKTDSLV